MRTRNKEHYTYDSVKAEIVGLEREMADLIVAAASNSSNTLNVNTVSIQQKVGRLKALREVLWK